MSAILALQPSDITKTPVFCRGRTVSPANAVIPDVIDRLMMIRFSRRLGFRISDMRELLLTPRGRRAKDVWHRLVDARLDEVGALIKAAKGVERVLRESRDCECVTLESCRFLRKERTRLLPSSGTWPAL
jgi:DNA-binding transcriptional MerR regulator